MPTRDHATSPGRSSWLSASLVFGSIVLVIGVLYVAREILIPIALAVLFVFILAPIVMALRRRGVGRTWSVILTVVLTFVLLGGIGMVLVYQVRSLADDLPAYRHNISRKISDLRLASRGGSLEKAQQAVQAVIQDVNEEFGDAKTNAPALPVVVTNEKSATPITALIGPMLEPLASAGLVIVLVIFMLLRREDLRDRLLRLAGYGRLAASTKAIDEAGKRLSRYLLRQFLLNAGFGISLGVGLYFIGLPYAILWGTLAAVARFVPYAGPIFSAFVPIFMSLAVFDGWNAPLLVIGLIVALELIYNLLLEPLVYGQSIEVSEVALLIMIAFWTWLWGPIGMVLAAPLTVCLMVISKDVPDLEFIGLLLSSKPALPPSYVFYQRLVAKDADEARQIVEEHLEQHSVAELYDSLLMPALAACRHDHERERLTDEDQIFAIQLIRQVIEDTGGAVSQITSDDPPQPPAVRLAGSSGGERPLLLGYPAHDQADELALLMLAELLRADDWPMRVLSANLLSAEALAAVDQDCPAVLCIGCLPGGSLFAARQFCKRIRERQPGLSLVLGRWLAQDQDEVRRRFAGLVTEFGSTLAEAKNQLIQLAQTSSGARVNPVNGPAPANGAMNSKHTPELRIPQSKN